MTRVTRRRLFPLALLPVFVRPARAADLQETIAGIEADGGGRLGVALLDPASGDKTGSGEHGSSNDVAVIWPAGRGPVIVTSYLTETKASDDRRNAAHAAVGRAVAAALGA
ncbi:beta-lactamase class A [Bradyrhizobium sp. USDA 4369]